MKATVLPEFNDQRPISDLEHVYTQLKQAFMIGEFEPGQRLPLPHLAEAFGTSQMPIREATSRLVVARAIEALPRRSLRVPGATTERLDALLPLRLMLEGEATRLAVRLGCEHAEDELEAINQEMDAMVATEDLKSYLRLNQHFHFTIYRKCGNSDLVDLIELLWMRYGPLMNTVGSRILSNTGHKRHAEVIVGMKEGNPEKSEAALRADIADAAESIRKVVEARATECARAPRKTGWQLG